MAEPLTPEKQTELLQALSAGLQEWRTHGRPVIWTATVQYNQILEVSAGTPVSGCATDTLFRTVKAITAAQGVSILPTDWVLVISEEKSFTKKFYEIIDIQRSGAWDPAWRVVETDTGGIKALPLEESRLAIHLSQCG